MDDIKDYKNLVYYYKNEKARYEKLKENIQGSLLPLLDSLSSDLDDAVSSIKNGFVIDGVTADNNSIKDNYDKVEDFKNEISGSVLNAIDSQIIKFRNNIYYYNKLIEELTGGEYKFAINSFFKDIETYDSWEGDAVDTYKSSVESDSVNYYNFIDDLIDFSNELSNIIDNAESSFATATKR